MKRTKRLAPATAPLCPPTTAGPSALAIASATIAELTAENERLRSSAATKPDIRVETALYEALQFERQRNAALTKAYHDAEQKFKRFRTNKLLHAVGSKLKPIRNPEPKEQ